MLIKLIRTALFFIGTAISLIHTIYQVQAIVLDAENRQMRTICGKKREVTPFQESLERGKTEGFAQFTGLITIKINEGVICGVGTLIGPNILLTAAHVVESCLDNPTQAVFDLENGSSIFSSKFKKIILRNEYPTKQSRESIKDQYNDLKINEKLNDEERSSIVINYIKSSLRENMNDIAIVFLKSRISSIKEFPTLDNGIENISPAYGVSVNIITKNYGVRNTNNSYNKKKRHIAVFNINRDSPESLLICNLKFPTNYIAQCNKNDKSEPFAYNYNSKEPSKGDQFLKGSIQRGDSGGPLLLPKKGSTPPVLIGIASTTQIMSMDRIFNSKITNIKDSITKEYNDIWTPISVHRNWIQETIIAEHY